MKVINGHRDLLVWRKSMDLVDLVYATTRSFPRSEMFGMTSQIRRAAVSVPANIAEGHGRTTLGEYGNQLSVARGSLKEVETLLEVAARQQLIDHPTWTKLQALSDEISRMLTALKRSIRA